MRFQHFNQRMFTFSYIFKSFCNNRVADFLKFSKYNIVWLWKNKPLLINAIVVIWTDILEKLGACYQSNNVNKQTENVESSIKLNVFLLIWDRFKGGCEVCIQSIKNKYFFPCLSRQSHQRSHPLHNRCLIDLTHVLVLKLLVYDA